MIRRPIFPQRVVEGTCVLDGPKFKGTRICRRCGYRRNAAKVMPRYEMCGSPPLDVNGEENPYTMGTKRVIPNDFPMANNVGTR